MDSYTHDFFISYHANDQSWVIGTLLPKLVQFGFSVNEQSKFEIGVPTVRNIEHAIISSRQTIVIVTPDWITSDWNAFEELITNDLDPASRNRRLLPIILKPCELPNRISRLTCADFTDSSIHDEALQHLLNGLKAKLEGTKTITVPFAIIAMTHKQALELIDETAFQSPKSAPIEQTVFRQIREVIPQQHLGKWSNQYGDTPESWKPFLSSDQTIQSTVLRIANNHRTLATSVRVVFQSSSFLSDDMWTRIDTWDKFSRSGCVIVVDAMSLLHPTLYRRLLQSEISSNNRAAIAMLMFEDADLAASRLIEAEINVRFERAFHRFTHQLDPLCQLDMQRGFHLDRWLDDKLPSIAKQILITPEHHNLAVMQNRSGQIAGMAKTIMDPWGE